MYLAGLDSTPPAICNGPICYNSAPLGACLKTKKEGKLGLTIRPSDAYLQQCSLNAMCRRNPSYKQ